MKVPNNAQLLILPVNNGVYTSPYKSAAYLKAWKCQHYGIDISLPLLKRTTQNRKIWGSGNGTVKAAGWDNKSGYTVIVVYPNVYVHGQNKVMDSTLRLYHMSAVYVKEGQAVTTSTVLGLMGNTGTMSSGLHVHCEFDADTKYFQHVPGLSSDSNIIKRGVDSTIDPACVFVVKADAPDKQTFMLANSTYATAADLAKFPIYPDCIDKVAPRWAIEIPGQTYYGTEAQMKAAAESMAKLGFKAVAESK